MSSSPEARDERHSLPVPQPTAVQEEYFAGLRRHETLIPRCDACGSWQWYPREMCASCHGWSMSWRAVEPVGEVYSFTTQHHATGSKFDVMLPYTVALVALDEAPGVRLVGRLVDVRPHDARIGLRVRGTYVDATEETTYLVFGSTGVTE